MSAHGMSDAGGLREAVEALHGGTHWCFDRDEQQIVFEPGTEWWPCPTLALLDAHPAPEADPTAGEREIRERIARCLRTEAHGRNGPAFNRALVFAAGCVLAKYDRNDAHSFCANPATCQRCSLLSRDDTDATDASGPDPGFASMCPRCGRGLVSVGEWCCGDWTGPATPDAGEASERHQLDAISARARGDYEAERRALDALALIERADAGDASACRHDPSVASECAECTPDYDASTSAGECACVGYAIRTDYGTGTEHDVDRSPCPVHSEMNDAEFADALDASTSASEPLSEAEVEFVYDWTPDDPTKRAGMAAILARLFAAREAKARAEAEHWRGRFERMRLAYRERFNEGLSSADWHAKHCAAAAAVERARAEAGEQALRDAADDLYIVYGRASKGPDVDPWTDGWAEGYQAAAFRVRGRAARIAREVTRTPERGPLA